MPDLLMARASRVIWHDPHIDEAYMKRELDVIIEELIIEKVTHELGR